MRRAAGLRNLNSSALHGVVFNSTLSNSFGSKRFSLSKSLIVLPKILFRVRVDPIWHLVRGRIAPWTGRKSVSVPLIGGNGNTSSFLNLCTTTEWHPAKKNISMNVILIWIWKTCLGRCCCFGKHQANCGHYTSLGHSFRKYTISYS